MVQHELERALGAVLKVFRDLKSINEVRKMGGRRSRIS